MNRARLRCFALLIVYYNGDFFFLLLDLYTICYYANDIVIAAKRLAVYLYTYAIQSDVYARFCGVSELCDEAKYTDTFTSIPHER